MKFLIALLVFAGCGAATPTAQVAGNWSYTWLCQSTLHGTLTLTQDPDGEVSGEIGFPVDYPEPIDATAAGWSWGVLGKVQGYFIELAATEGPQTDDPWWFDETVSDTSISGPAFGGLERKPGYTFSASR